MVEVSPPRVVSTALREVLLGESAMASGGHQPTVIGAHGFHSALAMRPAADGCAVAVMNRRRMPVRVKLYGHTFRCGHAGNFSVLVLFHRAAVGLYRPRATVEQRMCSGLIVDAICIRCVLVDWGAPGRLAVCRRGICSYF